MPQRDAIHDLIKKALEADGWEVTDDPYVISFGERFLFVDLGAVEKIDAAASRFLGARRGENRIAVEIKEFRAKSVVNELPMQLLIIDSEKEEVKEWIPRRSTAKS